MKKRNAPVQPTLKQAIDTAVKQGLMAADALEADFRKIALELQSAIDALSPWTGGNAQGDGQSKGAAAAFIRLMARSRDDIGELFVRQRASLDTVNLVFFGRTGTGKSSLIEALTHGNGESVSKGESDWTVNVRAVAWNDCRLLDTPGINGWGRTVSRPQLEGYARHAAETADIVLLCFDSQSQQETEFQKVAQWIEIYGKPAIAVLNCRNAQWRLPPRVALIARRRSQSQMVHQHVGNIQDGLSNLGLSGVPVVAISSKRALIARGKEPFKGPDEKTFTKLRAEFGPPALLAWSNLPALEAMLTAALEQGATGIRLGMLIAQLRGILVRLDEELAAIIDDARRAEAALDQSVTSILTVLGYQPPTEQARAPFADARLDVDLIEQVETLRGAPFQAPLEAEFQVYVKQLLTAHLSEIRSKTLQRAEEFVVDAFDARTRPEPAAFIKAVYRKDEMAEASIKILEHGRTFLQSKVRLVMRAAQVDIAVNELPASVEGDRGGVWGKMALGARTAGILTGTATTVAVGLAAANIWNPGGWTMAIIGAGGGIVATVLEWLGGASERKSEGARSKARRDSLTSARSSVHETVEAYAEKVAEAAVEQGRLAAASTLVPVLQELVAAHLILRAAAQARERFGVLRNALPQHTPQEIIARAAREVEQAAFPRNAKAANLLWRGDDWIADPMGLQAGGQEQLSTSTVIASSPVDLSTAGLRELLELDWPTPVAAATWMRRLHKAVNAVPQLRSDLKALDRLAATALPRLHVFGDYNAGKSSFIKRMLIESGSRLPDTLVVRADAATTEVVAYPWQGVLLVDSPGLQSRRDQDTAGALASFADASFMLCILQPSLLASTLDVLCPILLGDEELGIEPKLERTIFIIGRSDELGPDPEDDIKEYERACNRKRRELIQAFKRRGVPLQEDRVICVAADPYGRVGTRVDVDAAEYARFRAWDGIGGLVDAIGAMSDRARRAAVGRSIFDGGIMRLAQRLAAARVERARAVQQQSALSELVDLLDAAAREGQRLQGHIIGKLERLLDEATEGLIADALGAASEADLQKAGKNLVQWWKNEEFRLQLARWETLSRDDIDSWYKRTRDQVGLGLRAAKFDSAESFGARAYEGESFGEAPSGKRSGLWTALEKTVNAGGSRDVVYKIGKMIGTKFKPYGAVKLARKIAKIGAVLSAVGVGLDAVAWTRAIKAKKKRERARLQASEYIRASGVEIRNSLVGDGAKTGVRTYLAGQVTELMKMKTQLSAELEAARELQRTLDGQAGKLESLINAGRAQRTRSPKKENTDDGHGQQRVV